MKSINACWMIPARFIGNICQIVKKNIKSVIISKSRLKAFRSFNINSFISIMHDFFVRSHLVRRSEYLITMAAMTCTFVLPNSSDV